MVESLQEASEDVTYLTSQGYSATDAVAKVASAASLTKHQTDLLIYAYSAGIASEKRASAGGPFARLAEYDLPDPVKVKEIVFGGHSDMPKKEASVSPDKDGIKTASAKLPFDLRNLNKDLSTLTSEEITGLFSPAVKKAESEDAESILEKLRKPGSGVSMTRITVSISAPKKKDCGCEEECDCCDNEDDGFVHSIPQTDEERSCAGLKMMSPELSGMVDAALKEMLKESEVKKINARAEASREYARLGGMAQQLGERIQRQFEDSGYKAAGLASMRAFYPGVEEIVRPYIHEVLTAAVKTAKYDLLAVSRQHEFVGLAKEVHDQMEKAAELTIYANEAKAYYDELLDTYKNRPRGKKADWMKVSGLFSGAVDVGRKIVNTPKETVGKYQELGSQPWFTGEKRPLYSDAHKARLQEDADEVNRQYGRLASPMSALTAKNIAVYSMLNDFKVNDEILKAYSTPDLLEAYSMLAKTAPHLMRDKAFAKALLQQHMTQGRFAPTELEPLLKMDESLMRRYGVATGADRK